MASRLDEIAREAAPIFKLQGWTWGGSPAGPGRTPDALEIARTLDSLSETLRQGSEYVRSGRFRLIRDEDETGSVEYYVTLELGTL